MKTKIHTYSFNLGNVAEREPYHQLNARLSAEVKAGKRGHCMNVIAGHDQEARVWGGGVKRAEAEGITLETEYLFGNQWNSVEAGRVFDWYEGINFENRLLKFGHWLEITPEMEEIRRETFACGYTGKQMPRNEAEALGFINTTSDGLRGFGLKESDIHLLRLLPVWPEVDRRKPLSAEEKDRVLPLYIKARQDIDAEAIAKARAEVEAEYKKDSALAQMEFDGKTWLLDRGMRLENVIFYNHTARFSFGWREPYSKNAAEAMRKAVDGFPFHYDIKTEETK